MTDLDQADLSRALRAFVDDNTPTGPPPPLRAEGDDVRRRLPVTWLVAAAVVLLAAAAAGGWWLQRDSADGQLVVLDQAGASSDHLPSTTAEDWVTYADHVLVVTVTDDAEIPPSEEEVQLGEGLIGRQVTMSVDRVLWSHPDPDRPAPETVSWQAWGWQFKGDPDGRWPVVGSNTARVEPGQTYVVALAWEEARCAQGDARVPAQWVPLGGAAVVPADGGIIGVGEFEGRDQTAEQAKAADSPGDPNRTLSDRLAGEDLAELAAELERTTPGEPEVFTPPAPCP